MRRTPLDFPFGGEGPAASPGKARLRKGRNFARRVLSGATLAVLGLLLIWAGSLPYLAFILTICLLGAAEFYALAEHRGYRPSRPLGTAAVALVVGASHFLGEGALARLVMLLVLVTLAVFARRRATTLADGATTVLGFLYVGWLPAHLVLVRKAEGVASVAGTVSPGAGMVTLLVLLCACTDIGAYFTGKILGRVPLCPAISPHKTVEGALGGALAALAAGWWCGGFLGMSPFHRVALSVLVTLAAQLGDLWESALKRDAGVKDSGGIIEGHGGILDRFDSFFFGAPAFYFYVTTFMG